MNLADRGFTGSIPQLYEQHMVPLIFAPYAQDLAARALAFRPTRVLEIAAGTGAVTRHLAAELPANTGIVATDLNATMIEAAAALGTARAVEWRQADAQALPFDDASFDLVVCQFGAMFFPDRASAYAEVRRVLRPGGHFLFNVWDRIVHNELADVVTQAMAEVFPDDPPRFLARTPHGYHDTAQLRADLAGGGFGPAADVLTLPLRARAESAARAAEAYCHGTPLRNELEVRAPGRLAELTALAARAIAARFGDGPLDTRIQAHVVSIAR